MSATGAATGVSVCEIKKDKKYEGMGKNDYCTIISGTTDGKVVHSCLNASDPQGRKCHCGDPAATEVNCKSGEYCTLADTTPKCVPAVSKANMNAKLAADSACGGNICLKDANVCFNPDTNLAGNALGSKCLPILNEIAATTAIGFDAIKTKNVCFTGNKMDGTNGCTCIATKSGPCFISTTVSCKATETAKDANTCQTTTTAYAAKAEGALLCGTTAASFYGKSLCFNKVVYPICVPDVKATADCICNEAYVLSKNGVCSSNEGLCTFTASSTAGAAGTATCKKVSSSSGLSTGALVGIIVACVVVVAAIVVVVVMMMKKKSGATKVDKAKADDPALNAAV